MHSHLQNFVVKTGKTFSAKKEADMRMHWSEKACYELGAWSFVWAVVSMAMVSHQPHDAGKLLISSFVSLVFFILLIFFIPNAIRKWRWRTWSRREMAAGRFVKSITK